MSSGKTPETRQIPVRIVQLNLGKIVGCIFENLEFFERRYFLVASFIAFWNSN